MSFADERQALESYFSDNWETTSVKYQNVPFDQPKNTAWVSFAILPGQGEQKDLADAPLYRYAGVIQVDIFVPVRVGTESLRDLADEVAELFRNQQIESGNSGVITCRLPGLQMVGVESQHGFYRGILTIPYQRDVVFSG